MPSRAEVTNGFAKAYASASKRDKGRLLDEVVTVTGWSRDNARRRLSAAAKNQPGRQIDRPRKPRAPKYSCDALQTLRKVWAASGGQCGKYLAASMPILLDGLERHGELVDGMDRYHPSVRAELLAMSAASIDRYLKDAKATDRIQGVPATKPAPLLRSPIKVRRADVQAEPGFFEGDTVAHCGSTPKGEFARTVSLADVHTGWVFTRTVRNNANVHILAALKAAVEEIPFAVVGLDFDNGSEYLDLPVAKWASSLGIPFTGPRPCKRNHRAATVSRNNHLVRKYGFSCRYDTAAERALLNQLWRLVDDRLNYLTPTIRPAGSGFDRHGRRKRLYDRPRTPLDRLLAGGVLAPAQAAELIAYRGTLNPARISREIADLQDRLLFLAKDKTDRLCLETAPTALPDVRTGIRIEVS